MRGLFAALRSQIRYRIILPYIALTLLVMTVGAAIAAALVAASWEDRLTNELAQTARNTSEALVLRERDILNYLFIVAFAPKNDQVGAPAIAEAVGNRDPLLTTKALKPLYSYGIGNLGLDYDRIIVFDRNAVALADWLHGEGPDPIVIQGVNLADVAVVRDVLDGKVVNGNDKFSGLIVFAPDPQPYLYTIAPIKRGNDVVGGVLIGTKVDQLLNQIRRRTLAAITTLYDNNGAPIGSTVVRREDELPSLQMPGPALAQLRNGAAQSVFDVPVRNQTYLFAYSPLLIGGNQAGYYSVGLSRDFQISTLTFSRNVVIGITLALAVGAILLGVWVARMITRPLYALVDTAEAVTAGDLDRRSAIGAIGGIDELRRLGGAFNQMTEHLLGLYRTSRELGTTLDAAEVLRIATEAAQPFAPGTEALALLPYQTGWQLTARTDAAPPVAALSGHTFADTDALPQLIRSAEQPAALVPAAAGLAELGALHVTPLILRDTPVGALLLAHPQPDGLGVPPATGLLAVANMTASVLVNAALFDQTRRDASERSAILQSIADGVVVCDQDDAIVLMNPAAERILKLTDWRTRRVRFNDLPLEEATVSNDFGQEIAPTAHYQIDGLTVSRSDAPVFSEAGEAVGSVIVLRDISTEAAVDQAKTDFIATISHELRTPLTVIHGYTDLVLRGIAGPVNPDQREMLEQVRTRAEHMGSLFKNVITVASIAADKLDTQIAPLDLALAVEAAAGPLRGAIERRGQSLELLFPADLPEVLADREQLGLVLTQLLDNANRYADPGPIQVRASRNGRMVQLDVTDSGPGVPTDELGKLFRRFQRIEGNSNPVRGIGLGLAIARQLVERLGGRIWATNNGQRGTTFSFTLPASREPRP